MTTASLTKANTLTRDAVTQQLEWDSEFDASALGITERDGVVTLTSRSACAGGQRPWVHSPSWTKK